MICSFVSSFLSSNFQTWARLKSVPY
jgi:hypothetical protein